MNNQCIANHQEPRTTELVCTINEESIIRIFRRRVLMGKQNIWAIRAILTTNKDLHDCCKRYLRDVTDDEKTTLETLYNRCRDARNARSNGI